MVTFKKGRLSDYDNDHYITGCIYFLVDTDGNGHIYLNGQEYTCGEITSADVKLNENQTLDQVLPTWYDDNSGSIVKEIYLTQEQYDELDELDQFDNNTAYHIYEKGVGQ